MLHFRKGTRSRPNVKVPKYYHSDYEDIIKPLSRDTSEVEDMLFPIEKIKTEPIDVVENDIAYDSEIAVLPFLDREQNKSPMMDEEEEEDQSKEDASFEEIDNFVKITLSTQHLIKDIDINVEGEEEGNEKTISETENGTIEEALQSLKGSSSMEISTEPPKHEKGKSKTGLEIKMIPAVTDETKGDVPEVLEKIATQVEESHGEEDRTMPVLSPKEYVPKINTEKEGGSGSDNMDTLDSAAVDILKE